MLHQDFLSQQFSQLLKLPDLQLHLDIQWTQRKLLRLELEKFLRAKYNHDFSQLMDLTKTPDLRPLCSISISHCKEVGGFIYLPGSNKIGFDVEVSERVQKSSLARVSAQDKEVELAPTPAALWTAKEAVFKSLLAYRQPQVLSEINIGPWICVAESISSYSAYLSGVLDKPLGTGFVIKNSKLTFSVFITH